MGPSGGGLGDARLLSPASHGGTGPVYAVWE